MSTPTLPGNPHFGDRVRQSREAASMSRTELAQRIGLKSHSGVIRIEEDGSCSIGRAARIADILGVSLDALAGRETDALRDSEAIGRERLKAELIAFMSEVDSGPTVAESQFLALEDLSERWGIAIKTLYTWRTQGKGPKGFKIGKFVRYRLEDVEAWEQEQIDAGDDE